MKKFLKLEKYYYICNMKRYIITATYIFISSLVFSQTKLDSLVFDKLNQYRNSLGLSKIDWDSTSFIAAKNHSQYLNNASDSSKIISGHNQPTPGSERLSDRFGKDFLSLAEVATGFHYSIKDNSDLYLDEIAEVSIKNFIKSPMHNLAITNPKFKFTGVSVDTKPYSIKRSNILIVHTVIVLNSPK
jgi:uncharacterized protein YkwD